MCLQGGYYGESTVIGRNYFTRQATILLKFAKSTSDPQLAAALIEKAADLKSQLDETMPARDAVLRRRMSNAQPDFLKEQGRLSCASGAA
jgi:hypothetical protein